MTLSKQRFKAYADNEKQEISQLTQINHPDYYNANGHEAIDYIEAHGLNFNLGNVIKYITRAGKKDADILPDLLKANWYLNREIKRHSGTPDTDLLVVKPEITE